MSEPSELLVVRDLQRALQAVSIGDGYYYDVRGTAVQLNADYDVEPLVAENAPRPWVALQLTPEAWTYMPSMRVKLEMPVRVLWFNEADDLREDVLLTMAYRAYSDIERAITRDITRGGRASDTRIAGRTAEIQGGAVWVAVELVVTLIRTFGEASV